MDNGYKKKTKSLSQQTRGHIQCIKRHLKQQGIRCEVSGALVFHNVKRASIVNATVAVLDQDAIVDFIYRLPRTCNLEIGELTQAFSLS